MWAEAWDGGHVQQFGGIVVGSLFVYNVYIYLDSRWYKECICPLFAGVSSVHLGRSICRVVKVEAVS